MAAGRLFWGALTKSYELWPYVQVGFGTYA